MLYAVFVVLPPGDVSFPKALKGTLDALLTIIETHLDRFSALYQALTLDHDCTLH